MSSMEEVEGVFHRAFSLPEKERGLFLDELKRRDPELAQRVSRLLRAASSDDSLLDSSRHFSEPESISDPIPVPIPPSIGHYQVIREIGAGGMGVVYEAIQANPRRRVALKVLDRGRMGRASLSRFQKEAEHLARLDHQGIAKVYEAGVDEARGVSLPFIAIEMVEGARSVTEYSEYRDLTRRHRLELFLHLAKAIEHSHAKGIVHRDLKPENVLVSEKGELKVIDFGVARLEEGDSLGFATQTGQLLGTLTYMSPEQLEGASADAQSDVYALGVILYEMIWSDLPWDLENIPLTELIQVLGAREPGTKSSDDGQVDADLQAILLTAMSRERSTRYGSVKAFREDVERYLRHEPVTARAPSRWDRLRSLARRHRGLAYSASAMAIIIVTSLVVVTWLLLDSQRTVRDLKKAQEQEEAQRVIASKAQLRLAELRRGLDDAFGEVPMEGGRDSFPIGQALVRSVSDSFETLTDPKAKEEFLNSSLNTLRSFDRLVGNDVAFGRSLAACYLQIGRIRGARWDAPPEEALVSERAFDRASKVFARLAESYPESALIHLEWSKALTLQSQSLRKLRSHAAAFDVGQKALDLALQADQSDPSIRTEMGVIEALWARGDASIPQGVEGPGLEDSHEAVRRSRDLLGRHPKDAGVLNLFAWSMARVGIWLFRQYNQLEEALPAYREAVQCRLRFCRQNPSDRLGLQGLLTQCGIEVQVLWETQGADSANARLVEICEFATPLVFQRHQDEVTTKALVDLELWIANLAVAGAEKEIALERLLTLSGWVEDQSHPTVEHAKMLGALFTRISRLELENGLITQARDSALEAVRVTERRSPDALESLASAREALGETEEARRLLHEATQLLEESQNQRVERLRRKITALDLGRREKNAER